LPPGWTGIPALVSLQLRLMIGIAAALRAVLIPGEAANAMAWDPRVPSIELAPEHAPATAHVATP
jgi:hypothetical protein